MCSDLFVVILGGLSNRFAHETLYFGIHASFSGIWALTGGEW